MTDEGEELGPAPGGLKDIQKKTFTKWINSQLERSPENRGRVFVTDLYYDLRDGRILLEVLEVLTGRKLHRERGSLRIHQLGNVTTALKTVRDEERVSLLNIDAVDIVDGNPKMTLALVWNLVLCFQFHKVIKTRHLTDLERSLLAWCRRSVAGSDPAIDITDFSKSFRDGLAFNLILHHHRPHLFDMDLVVSKTPLSRLDFAFRMLQQHLGLPRLLDPEDIHSYAVDKRSVMTYLMCMYQVFPHDDADEEYALQEVTTPEKHQSPSSTSGPLTSPPSSLLVPPMSSAAPASPLRVPPKFVTKGRFFNYDDFCSMCEDVLSWVVQSADDLKAFDKIADDLETVQTQTEVTIVYLSDLNKYQPAIGDVLKVGHRLMDDGLNTAEANDVKIRGNLLNSHWESLRKCALTRQKELFDKLMILQQKEINILSEWMTEVEDRISRMGGLAGNLTVLARQEEERSALINDLEEQAPRVSRVSRFIYIDSESNSQSDQPDLEGQVMAQGERWLILCAWVEERSTDLRKMRSNLESLERDRSALDLWLQRTEASLRKMEMNPSNDRDELSRQARSIEVIQQEMTSEQERLSRMDLTSESICNVVDKQSRDKDAILKTVEGLQDRWEILTEILEAQRHRIATIGIETIGIETIGVDQENTTTPDLTKNESQLQNCSNDETASKKRKITGSKRIEFETAYAKAASWLNNTIEMLTPVVGGNDVVTLCDEDEEKLFANVESHITENSPTICQTVEMGENLIRDIQSETDYPPGYLNNVTEKVTSIKMQFRDIESQMSRLRDKLHYKRSKANLYSALDFLRKMMTDNQNDLANLQLDSLTVQDIEELTKEIQSKKIAFETHSNKIAELRRLAGETSLHPGAVFDPTNTIKTDICDFCEAWKDFEKEFSDVLERLNKIKEANLYSAMDLLRQIMSENRNDLANIQLDSLTVQDIEELIEEIESKKTAFEIQSSQMAQLFRLFGETSFDSGTVLEHISTIKTDIGNFCEAWKNFEKEFADLVERLNKVKEAKMKSDEEEANEFFVRDIHEMEDHLCRMRASKVDPNKVSEYEGLLLQFKKYLDEVEGLNVWMNEVDTFLKTEHTASSDPDTLDAQLKESTALQDDVTTLQPTVDAINELGIRLLDSAQPQSDFAIGFERQLREINSQWESTINAARQQFGHFQSARDRLQVIVDGLDEMESFIEHVEAETPGVAKPDELTKFNHKLSRLRDKIEKKKSAIDKLSSNLESSKFSETIERRWSHLKDRWESVCVPVIERHKTVKLANQEYGELKTLAAQEKDWLERLEKKLNRSVHTAADAEEISEELMDIENFIRHHPDHRLFRIKELSQSLSDKNLLPSSMIQDAQKLDTRWQELSQKARQRTTILEGSIAEAQEWELKIIAVQEWLTERDMLITSHLDHDLTVADLPDESQREMMLREFEDQENLLAELDEQVDAYREAGKLEAAARLEDQLHLIHGKFQELSMKFELFQQNPAVDFEPHLDRVARQLRDIREKLYLTELASSENEGIEGQLNHATCIINALSDIKPEVENVIKMGRKIVESESSQEDKENLARKIDQLKKDFNETGSEVSDAKETLENAHQMSRRLQDLNTSLRDWLISQIKDLSSPSDNKNALKRATHVKDIAKEMASSKRQMAEDIVELRIRFYEMCNPSLLVILKENVQTLGEKWSELSYLLTEKAAACDDADLAEALDTLAYNPFQLEERKTSSVATQEDGPLLEEFRSAFQEVSQWIDSAEAKLMESRRSEERALGREIEEWRPKVGNLRNMAEKLVQIFVGQKNDVEPEMEMLGHRWNEIVKDVEERLASNREFKMVEVENIRTTISHLRIPASEPVITMSSGDADEEIVTLPETPTSGKPSSPNKRHRSEEVNGRYSKKATPLGREMTLLSSGDSSPDPDSSETRLSSRLNSSGEKVPPKTLPKPDWYLRARKQSPGACAPLLSPERVKVVVSSLPSPQKVTPSSPQMVVVATTQIHIQPQAQMAQREVFPASTSPSTCSPMSETPPSILTRMSTRDNDNDDEDLARENATIDRLLLEANADLAEVSRKVSRSSRAMDNNMEKLRRETSDFETSASCMIIKMKKSAKKLNELDVEYDLRLRQDLIDMESRFLEAEVATLISRGDTLVLMTDRHDYALGQETQATVQQLRDQWQQLKQLADKKKNAAKSYQDELYRFRSDVNDLKTWLGHTLRQTTWARASNLDKATAEKLKSEAESRRNKLKELNATAANLKGHSALGGQELALTVLNSDWEELERKLNLLVREDDLLANSGYQGSPQQRSKGPAGQISSRIEKMREVTATIEQQLTSLVLGGKHYENLSAQSDALDLIRQTLEKVRFTSKKVEKDLEVLYGSLSMEYFEKITGQSEKLRKEMDRANQKFSERQELFRHCTARRKDLDHRQTVLIDWLDGAEKRISTIASTEASDTGKKITDFAVLAKEIVTCTSQEEAILIQEQVEEVMKKWKHFLRLLAESKTPAMSKDLERLVHWVDSSLVALQKPIQFNDLEEARETAQLLETISKELPARREDAHKLNDSSTTTRSLRAGIEKISQGVPKKLRNLKEKLDKIQTFQKDFEAAEKFTQEIQNVLEEVRHDLGKQEILNQLHLTVENKQYEINAILCDYVQLEKEAKNDELSRKVQEFKEQWLKLRSQLRLSMSSLLYENSITTAQNGAGLAGSAGLGNGNPGSIASVSSLDTTTHETQASRTTYYNSQASFMTEEADPASPVPPTYKESIVETPFKDTEEFLKASFREERLAIHDTSEIRASISRQMALLRSVDAKRSQLDKISLRDLRNEDERLEMQTKLNRLREQFDEKKHQILSRKSECTAMAGDSEQYGRKVKEIETWLQELEADLSKVGPLGATVDVIEEQQEIVLSALKKLSKYNHHIQLFTQMCQRIQTLYPRDDSSEIERCSNDLYSRYTRLNDRFSRLKVDVQKARHSFTSFDKSVTHFLGWLSEMESNVDNLEFQVENTKDGQENLPSALEDIKKEMLAKDREFNALSRFGDKLLRSLSQDEKVVLAQRLSEVNQRWKALQNKMLNLGGSVSMSSNSESSAQHRIPAIHATLRDHQDWVLRKKRELESLSLAKDVSGLQKQLDENATFMDQIQDRGVQIQSSLSTAKELQNGLIDTQGFQESVSKLETEFSALVLQSEDWNSNVANTLIIYKNFEDEMKKIETGLSNLESKESLMTNGLDALEADIHSEEMSEMSTVLDSLSNKLNHLKTSKAAATNPVRVTTLEGRIASLRLVLDQRASTQTPTHKKPRHESDYTFKHLPPGWERDLMPGNIPYYVDHNNEKTQWDHPEFAKLMDDLLEMNIIKFSAYRLAMKLRAIQKLLHLDLLDVEVAHQGFEENGLTYDRHDMAIRVPEMAEVLKSFFEAIKEEEGSDDIDPRFATELTVNWLLNVYDRPRTGQVRVFSFKLAILVMCRGPLTEKYIHLFNLAAAGSPNKRLDHRRLGLLLYDCVQIPKYLGEVAAFGGSNIEPSVRSCFATKDGEENGGTQNSSVVPDIDCQHFLRWVKKEPQSLVWFPVLQRLSWAENARHSVKCRVCHTTPMIGFRYRCDKCFNYDLCQSCFFIGLTSKSHKLDHPMKEYCTSTGKTDTIKIFTRALRNSFRSTGYFKKKQQKLGYLPVNSVLEGEDFSTPIVSPNLSLESRDFNLNSSSGSLPKRAVSVGRAEVSEEHDLIAKYCHHLHTQESNNRFDSSAGAFNLGPDFDKIDETIERQDLEQMIAQLEEEHRRLLSEHDQLSQQLADLDNDDVFEEDLREKTRRLRQDTLRMEARMNIIQDHNRQLEAQLQRLRQLLMQQPSSAQDVSTSSASAFGTLQSKSVVAADLHVNEHEMKESKADRRMPPPPITKLKHRSNGGGGDETATDSGSSIGDGDFRDSHSSLDLSEHETQRESD